MRRTARTAWIALAALLAFGGCNKSAANNAQPNNAQQPSNAQPAANASTPDASQAANQPQAPPPTPAPPPPPPPIVIPAGKVLTVTVDQEVSTKTANAGDHFDASLAEPVRVNGTEVLRAGTKVSGVVTQAQSAGRLKGSSVLGLGLDSITVHGKTYRLETSSVAENSKGRGKRTGIGAGGGAAFGAIIGAIAGGGKGAALGALAGGGAGAGGAAFTGKRDITVPAETRLDFKLAEPVTISRGEGASQ
jgi:hypothetical protein